MAIGATDFSEYTTGVQPSDWTRRFEANFSWTVEEDASGIGGKVLRCVAGAANARNGLSWDVIDALADRDDAQLFFRVRFPTGTDNAEALAMVRGSGTTSATLYRHGRRDNEILLSKYVSGSYSSISFSSVAATLGVWINVLVTVRGTTQSVKVWEDGVNEPANPQESQTDSSISGVGWIGLFRFRDGGYDIDYFSYGTGTDDAPRPGTGGVVLSSATSAKNGETGYTGSVDVNTANGTLYHVVTTSVSKPTQQQIQAGEDHNGVPAPASGSQAVSSVGTKQVSGSGLVGGTTYYIHYQHSATEGESLVVTSPSFTTDEPPPPVVPVPVNLNATQVTSNSALLTWEQG